MTLTARQLNNMTFELADRHQRSRPRYDYEAHQLAAQQTALGIREAGKMYKVKPGNRGEALQSMIRGNDEHTMPEVHELTVVRITPKRFYVNDSGPSISGYRTGGQYIDHADCHRAGWRATLAEAAQVAYNDEVANATRKYRDAGVSLGQSLQIAQLIEAVAAGDYTHEADD